MRVKFAPAAWSRWSISRTPRLMPTNGGARTTAASPALARITGTSSRNATGLYAHRSVIGRPRARWEGGDVVRMGFRARIPRGGRYHGTPMTPRSIVRAPLVAAAFLVPATVGTGARAQGTPLPSVDGIKGEG